MVPKTPNPDEHLVAAKHGKGDLFICDVADAVLKDLIPQMEHPFYSLSKKPETAIRRYEHNGNWLEIVPSVKGLATTLSVTLTRRLAPHAVPVQAKLRC